MASSSHRWVTGGSQAHSSLLVTYLTAVLEILGSIPIWVVCFLEKTIAIDRLRHGLHILTAVLGSVVYPTVDSKMVIGGYGR